MNEDHNLKLKKMGFVFLTILSVFVIVKLMAEIKGLPYVGKSESYIGTISVNGKGEVIAVPDIATFSFSVTEEAEVVADAQKVATLKTNAILAFLKEKGVEEKDVKTSNYNIYQRHEYTTTSAYPYNTGKRVLAAYVVTQSVEVKVRKTEEAGMLIAGIGGLGATDISGLNFSVDKYDELIEQARAEAIKDARDQAKVLAKDLGVKLVRVTSFYDQGNYPPIYYARAVSSEMGGDMQKELPAPELSVGENKIISNVSITYEIR